MKFKSTCFSDDMGVLGGRSDRFGVVHTPFGI
jgi:hypothetical protein